MIDGTLSEHFKCEALPLFCNVFRIGRPMEASWAATFVLSCLGALALDLPFWPVVLSVTVPATFAVVTWGWKVGRYNGIRLRRFGDRMPFRRRVT